MGSKASLTINALQSSRSTLGGPSSIEEYLFLSPLEKVRIEGLQFRIVKTKLHSATLYPYDRYRAREAKWLEFKSLVEKLPRLDHLDLGCWRNGMDFPSAVFEYEAFPSVRRLTLRRWSDFGGSKSIYNKIDYTALEHLTLDSGYVTAQLRGVVL